MHANSRGLLRNHGGAALTSRIYTMYLEPPLAFPNLTDEGDLKYADSQEMRALKLEFWLRGAFEKLFLNGTMHLTKVEVFLHDIP